MARRWFRRWRWYIELETPKICKRHKIKMFLVLATMMLVAMVIGIVPLRNTCLGAVIPLTWHKHSTMLLLKMMMDDTQRFPIHNTPFEKRLVDVEVTVKQKKHFVDLAEEQLKTFVKKFKKQVLTNKESLIVESFSPALNQSGRYTALVTMEVFFTACRKYNLTYFLGGVSLLGAVRHHAMVPWDTRITIFMDGLQWQEIRNILSSVEGYSLLASPTAHWRFYRTSDDRGLQWPNIEIFFFHSDESYIWSITPTRFKDILCNNKPEVFPLVLKTFEEWEVPVPRKAAILLSRQFGEYSTECVSHTHDSRGEVIFCEHLYKIYSFQFPGQLETSMKNSGKIKKLGFLQNGQLFNPF